MKKNWIIASLAICMACLMSISVAAQTSAGASAGGNASVTPGQASAGANASQSAQTPAASANVGTGANATASHQEAQGKDSSGSSSAGLSGGTTLQAELSKSLDAKKAKSGDEVTAKLTQDVKSDGKVVLHKGTKLVGHVTEAQAKTKDNAESKLGIVFDKAVVKGGQEIAFNGAVQALAAPVPGPLALSGGGSESGDVGANMPRGGGAMGGAGSRPVGGVGSTVSGATGAVGNTVGSATGAVGGAVNNTAGTAVNGTINNTSHGVVGLQGVTLNTATAGSAQGSVLTSATQNVKLDAGTQMVLQVVH